VFWENDEIVFRTGQENINTEKFTDRNGVTHTIVTTKSLYVDPTGKRYVVGVIRDITESERAKADREKLEKQLLQAQKMEAVGTLAGGIAHDFNNILQVVLGYSELVLADEDLPVCLKNDLRKVLLSARNGADLVRRLLTFSRKTETKPLDLNLNQRVRQNQKFLERTIPKMINIEMVLEDDLADIHADPTQMDQVLMNLSVNARDAMPDGGKLILQTANVVIDEDYARSHLEAKPGRYVLLRVSDTGSGIDKETLEHIFEPFFTTKGLGQGTGLGLAMVFGVVKQHQGFVNCYSEIGHGTTFKIYLPAVISLTRSDLPIITSMPQGGTETILLVDDEELIRDLGQRILSKAGYTILTASNGEEALDLYRSNKGNISMVMLDLIMPGMGGKRCLEELLVMDPNVKVLVASGYSADGPTKEALSNGAKGFVAKPFDMREVLEMVRKTIDEQ
jgi:two-component system cell cycle sensor histidine kinase/response regulator CckA